MKKSIHQELLNLYTLCEPSENPQDIPEHITQRNDAIHKVFCLLEELLRNGNFEEVDIFLDDINVKLLTPIALLSFLTITFHGKKHLINRLDFLIRAEEQIRTVLGDERTEKLLLRRR